MFVVMSPGILFPSCDCLEKKVSVKSDLTVDVWG